jgi:hypothetical protein
VRKLSLLAASLFLSISCATVKPELSQISAEPTVSSVKARVQTDGIPQPVTLPGNTLLLSFGPKLLELKASYVEKQEPTAAPMDPLQNGTLRRHLNLLATSSFGGSGWTGEGELSYGPPSSSEEQCVCGDWPRMLRLGLRNRWGGLRYGAEYRSIERGFVSLAGTVTDQTRDEGRLWGEHSLGPVNFRGTIGGSRESLPDTSGRRLTKSATTSFSIYRSQWGGAFASSYGWVEQGPGFNRETTVSTHALTGFYRPVNFLSFNPNFSITEEHSPFTGIRTETPRTALIFSYAPPKDPFRLTGATSFGRSFSDDGVNTIRTLVSTAALDWKMGRFLGKDDTLSLNFNYNQQTGYTPSVNYHSDVSGTLRLTVTGF